MQALQQLVLAAWWFVHPYLAAKFDEYVRHCPGHAEGLADFYPEPSYLLTVCHVYLWA